MRERNESFDIRVLNLAAIDYLQPDWKRLKENLESVAEKSNAGTKREIKSVAQVTNPIQIEPERPNNRRMKIRTSWMNGF